MRTIMPWRRHVARTAHATRTIDLAALQIPAQPRN